MDEQNSSSIESKVYGRDEVRSSVSDEREAPEVEPYSSLRPNSTHISYRFAKNTKQHEHGDLALKYINKEYEGKEVPPEIRKSLSFKANIYLFAFMGWCYCLQFADKTIVNGCSVVGLRSKDVGLDMTGYMYSWVGSSFYFGYLVGILPMVFLMQRFPVATVTSICYTAWALVLTLSAASQNYAGFVTTRVIMGILESAVTPAFTILTTQWFPRHSHFSRTCFWFGCNGLGTVLASSITYGVWLHHDNIDGAPWRGLLIIMGLITLVTSIAFYLHVPNSPAQAWFLTEEEKKWQVEVIRDVHSSSGYGTGVIKSYQVWEALRDPATWLGGFYVFLGNVPNGATTNFATILLQGLGFTNTGQSLLMTMPGGAIEFVCCILTGILSIFVFKNQRMVYAIFCSAFTVLCYCLLAWGPNSGSQLFGYYANSWSGPIGMIALLSNIGSNSAGYTKKLVTNGIFLLLYAAGNIVGPQTFKQKEAPHYQTGKTSMAATTAASLVMLVTLCLLNVYRNYQRNKRDERLPKEFENHEFADLTDFENPEFRYAM